MKQIKLTQGQVALVDDSDFDYLNQYKWFAQKGKRTFYARRIIALDNRIIRIYMHRVILGLIDRHVECDHCDNNGLNNCRSNLRVATHAQNSMNTNVRSDNTSGFKGVCWSKGKNKWVSKIFIDGKSKHLGYFLSKIEAAQKYNEGAVKYHGEFAKLNEQKV